MKEQPNWYGLDMLPVYLDLSHGQLEASLEQLQNLESCKDHPYVLDNHIVERIIKSFTDQNDLTWVFIEQCRRWRQQNPTPKQLKDIDKVEQDNKKLEKVNNQVLFLANHYKNHTLERMLEKDDGELAMDYFLGKLYDPLKDHSNDITPFGPGSDHDLDIFSNPNKLAIKKFYQTKPKGLEKIPSSLAEAYQDYVIHRSALSDFHEGVYKEGIKEIVKISQELGNFDPVEEKAVIQNDSEMNVFYDYFSLYRQKKGKRFVCDWLEKNPKALKATNEKVVKAYCNARFAVLRLDKNLAFGAIQVVDVISQSSFVLIDKALNASQKEGCFFCCSILEMGDYIMTSGGGIPLDGHSQGGKAVLTLVANHLDQFQKATVPFTPEIAKGVQKIYGFCLRNEALSYMTTNQNY